MAIADTARMIVDLSLKGNFASAMKANQKLVKDFDTSVTQAQSRSFRAGQQIGNGIKNGALIAAGAIGFLATNVGLGLRSLSELESITAQTNAVLKSTKSAAGQTSASIRTLSERFESLNATMDDKVIQSGANVLLTFTNIRKQAFEPTLQAALDMNQALGGGEEGLQGTIQRLGKALNDPIKGLTQLGRVGVTFTKQQKDQIKAAVEAGDTFKAQGIILAELNKRFGGSFLAGGATTQGKIAKFKDSIEDLQKALATALLPTIGKVADGLSKFLADPAVIKGVEDLGKSIASLFSDANLKAGADFLKGAFETAKDAAPVVAAGAKATFSLVQAAVGLFRSLPPEIQKLAIGAFAVNKLTGGLVTNIAGGIIDVVGKNFLQRGGTPANPLFVKDVTGGLGATGAIGGATSKAGKVLSAIGKVFLVGAAVGAFAELKGILDEQSSRNKEQAAGLSGQTQGFVKVAGIDQMRSALAGIEAVEAKFARELTPEAIAFNANIDGVKDAIHRQQDVLRAAITEAEGKSAYLQVHATERAEAIASQKAAAIKTATDRATMAVRRTEAAENRSARTITAQVAAARRAQVAATNHNTSVLAAKKLSATLYSTVKVINNVNAREVGAAVGSFVKYFSTTSGGSSTRARAT